MSKFKQAKRLLVGAVASFVSGYLRGHAEADIEYAKDLLRRAKTKNSMATTIELLVGIHAESQADDDLDVEPAEH